MTFDADIAFWGESGADDNNEVGLGMGDVTTDCKGRDVIMPGDENLAGAALDEITPGVDSDDDATVEDVALEVSCCRAEIADEIKAAAIDDDNDCRDDVAAKDVATLVIGNPLDDVIKSFGGTVPDEIEPGVDDDGGNVTVEGGWLETDRRDMAIDEFWPGSEDTADCGVVTADGMMGKDNWRVATVVNGRWIPEYVDVATTVVVSSCNGLLTPLIVADGDSRLYEANCALKRAYGSDAAGSLQDQTNNATHTLQKTHARECNITPTRLVGISQTHYK